VLSIFRDRAIAAQSGHDALDQRVHVVPVRAWIALALALVVLFGGALWLFGGNVAVMASGPGTVVNSPGNLLVAAPVSGILAPAQAEIGARVDANEVIAVIASGADQQEIAVRSAIAGTIVGLGPGPGAGVAVGEQIAIIAPNSERQVAYAFVPTAEAGELAAGPTAWLLPANLDPTEVGYIRGTVASVSPLPVPTSRIAYVLADPALAERVAAQGPVLEVLIALEADDDTPSGLAWTQSPGPSGPIVSGTPASASIVVAELPPYRAFFNG
jgi:hypothetical protein